MPRMHPPDVRPLMPLRPALRAASFDFAAPLPEHKQSLARVLNHIRRVANHHHGTGGCSAFQVAVELTRCLVVAFAFSAQGPSPCVDVATRFALHCFALVDVYEEDAGSAGASNTTPDRKCWASFFSLVSVHLAAHPDNAIACELPVTMLARVVHIDSDNLDDFEGICERFANSQLGTLAARVCRQPAVLASSILNSVRTVIYKPPEDAADCAFKVSRFLGQSLREHNIAVHPANISRAFEKVLASCAFWNGIATGRTFAIAFMQHLLPSSAEDALPPNSAVLTVDALVTTNFIRLVAWCAVRWHAEDADVAGSAPELQENGESIAVEHVLDSLLKCQNDAHPIPLGVLETVAVRELPDLPDPCLTRQEYNRVLYRRESHPLAVIRGEKFAVNLLTCAGAPPINLHPPACPLTPAEIVCYFPHALNVPQVWRWVVGHGWSAFNIPKFVNKARDLRGIWSLEHSSFRNWQRKTNATFRNKKDLRPLPHTRRLDISPYVRAHCSSSRVTRHRQMIDMSMSRLTLPIKHHPVGEDAGYFTAMAQYAASNGDLGAKILVRHICHKGCEEDAEGDGEGTESQDNGEGHNAGDYEEENGDNENEDEEMEDTRDDESDLKGRLSEEEDEALELASNLDSFLDDF